MRWLSWTGMGAVAVLGTLASASVSAGVVLSTNFDGRTVSGATASNLNWVTDGVADPGSLTAVATGGTTAAALFITAAAANRFAVDLNIFNESPWTVDIPLQVLAGQQIDLGTVSLDAYTFNNQGALQGVNRILDLTLTLLDDSDAVLASVVRNGIYPNNGPFLAQGQGVSFDLSGNTLLAGGDYTLRLRAAGRLNGNNAGFDNLVVNGTVSDAPAPVPEPATWWLALGALGALAAARRRRAA